MVIDINIILFIPFDPVILFLHMVSHRYKYCMPKTIHGGVAYCIKR